MIGRIGRIGLIGRICNLSLPLPGAFFAPRGGKLFAVAATLDELLLKLLKLAVQQLVGLMNQADDRVGSGFRRLAFDERAVGTVRGRRCFIGPIGRISLIGPMI